MADLSPEQVNKLISALESIPPGLTELKEQLSKSVKKELDYNQRLKKSAEDVKAKFDNLKKQLDENLITQEQYKKATKELANSSKELAVVSEEVKSKVKEFGSELNTGNENLKRFGKGMGDFALAAVKHTTDIAKSVQNSTKGYELAGALVSKGADLTSGALTGAGNMASDFGSSLMSGSKKARGFGVALELLGGALKFGGQAASAVKPGFEILLTQLKFVTDGYDKSVSAGAVFADSYAGFAKTANDSTLTIRQFGEFISKNNSVLQQSGIGIAQAAQRVGAVGKVLKDSGTDQQLMKLGYGFEEQAEITAKVMADMRRAGRDISAVSTGEIAEQTEKYATNLRVIAAITGKDAKQAQEKSRQELTNLSVQAEIQRRTRAGDTNAQQRFESVQSIAVNSGKLINDATRQLLGPGQLMGDTAKTFALLGPAGEEFRQKILDIKNDKSLDPAQAAAKTGDAVAELNKRTRENEGMMQTLGTAVEMAGSKLAGYSGNIAEFLDKTNGYYKGAGETAQQNAEAAKKAQGDLDEGIKNSNIALQAMQKELDKASMTVLPGFAAQIGAAGTALVNLITAFNDQSMPAKVTEGIGATIMAGLANVFGPSLGAKVLDGITGMFGGGKTPSAVQGLARHPAGAVDAAGKKIGGQFIKAGETAARVGAGEAATAGGLGVGATVGGVLIGGAALSALATEMTRGEFGRSMNEQIQKETKELGFSMTAGMAGDSAIASTILHGTSPEESKRINESREADLAELKKRGGVKGFLAGIGINTETGVGGVPKFEPTAQTVQPPQVVNADATRNPAGQTPAMPTPDPAVIAAEATARAQAAAQTTATTPGSEQRKDPMEVLFTKVAAMQEQVIISNMYLKDIRTYTEKTAQRVG